MLPCSNRMARTVGTGADEAKLAFIINWHHMLAITLRSGKRRNPSILMNAVTACLRGWLPDGHLCKMRGETP